MSPLDEALTVLGLGPDTTEHAVRRRFRTLLKQSHPDRGGGEEQVRQLIEAYQAVLAGFDEHGALPSPPADAALTADVVVVESTPLHDAPSEVFDQLAEALRRLGRLTVADRESGHIEAHLRFVDGPASDLTVVVANDGDDTTALFTLVSCEDRPAPPIDAVVARVLDQLSN